MFDELTPLQSEVRSAGDGRDERRVDQAQGQVILRSSASRRARPSRLSTIVKQGGCDSKQWSLSTSMQQGHCKQVAALYWKAPVFALSMALLAGHVEARDSINAGLTGQFWYSLDGDYYRTDASTGKTVKIGRRPSQRHYLHPRHRHQCPCTRARQNPHVHVEIQEDIACRRRMTAKGYLEQSF